MSPTRCQPPPLGLLKFNWNATCDKVQGKIRIGVIVRDSKGMAIGNLRARRLYVTNPLTVEALALLTTIKFSYKIRISNFILEDDTLQVVKLLGEG